MRPLPHDLFVREWSYRLGEQVLVIAGLFSESDKLFELRLFDLTRMHLLSTDSCEGHEELMRRQADMDADLQSAGWRQQQNSERRVSAADTKEAGEALVRQWQAPWATALAAG